MRSSSTQCFIFFMKRVAPPPPISFKTQLYRCFLCFSHLFHFSLSASFLEAMPFSSQLTRMSRSFYIPCTVKAKSPLCSEGSKTNRWLSSLLFNLTVLNRLLCKIFTQHFVSVTINDEMNTFTICHSPQQENLFWETGEAEINETVLKLDDWRSVIQVSVSG